MAPITTEQQVPTMVVAWGPPGSRDAVMFTALRLNMQTAQQEHPALRTGPNVDRTGRAGLFAFVLDNLAGGFRPLSTIGSYGFDKTKVWKNEGIMVHIPGLVCLPYLLTSQASVISGDFTGLNATNRRVHAVNWATASGLRFIAGVGPNIIKDTSVSNPALTVPATSDAVTDDILTMLTGPVDGEMNALIIGTDGNTDAVKYTTDPTADTIVWTPLVTFPDVTDRCDWLGWFPQLGTGWYVGSMVVDSAPGLYAFKSTDTAPLTINTLVPVSYEATKDELGTTPSVTTAATFVNFGSSNVNSGELRWIDTGNITVSDNQYASNRASAAGGGVLDELIGYGCDFGSVPKSAKILGILVEIEAKEAAGTNNTDYISVRLIINGSVTGLNHADATELTLADTFKSFGGSSDTWGLNDLTGEDIQGMGAMVQFEAFGALNANDIDVDAIRITLTYQFPGTQMVPVQGAWSIGPLPSQPNSIAVVEPITDDTDGIVVQRVLKRYDFVFDTAGDRPVGSVLIPPISMAYVGVAAHYQGGIVVIGSNNSSVFNECKLVDSEGIVRNLNMPKTHADEEVTAVKAWAQGNSLLVEVSNLDNTDTQLWMFFDGLWHALGPLQSKSSAITQRPIYWAETVVGLEQSQNYVLIPNSTTSLMGTRQFVSPGLFDDPHLTNTTQIKHDGPLAVTLPLLDMGTIETNKSLLTLEAQSFRIDNDTLYGTAQLEIDTTGDLDLTTPAVDETFGTGVGQTPPFVTVPTDEDANNPGVSIPTAVIRLTLDNQASSAKSPQPLPIVFWMTGQWDQDDTQSFFLPQAQRNGTNISHIYSRMKNLAGVKPSQWLSFEGLDGGAQRVRAAFLGARFGQTVKLTVLDGQGKPQTTEYQGAFLDFRELPE